MDVLADDEISFFRKVSSEGGWDYLRFYIDGSQMGEWSGEESWAEMSYPVTQGFHTFKWAYEKDGSESYGEDCGWIDYIIFPAATGSGNVLNVTATASPAEICNGESSQLHAFASGGSGNYTYQWTPETGLSDPNSANPVATPDVTTNYSVTVNDGSSSVTDEITLTVHPVPETPEITQEDDHLVSSAGSGNQWYDSNGIISGATGQTYYPTITDHFYVIVNNEFGCSSDQSNVIYFIYTGLNKNIANHFNIYPNPFVDHFTVEFNLPVESDISICLYNKLGQKTEILLEETKQNPGFYQLEFSKPELNQGIYFITIKSSTFSVSRKLIIAK